MTEGNLAAATEGVGDPGTCKPYKGAVSRAHCGEKLLVFGFDLHHLCSVAGIFQAQLVFDSWPFITRVNYKYA